MNLFTKVKSKYGREAVKVVCDFETAAKKILCFRNHLVLSLRYKQSGIRPPSLRLRCPVNSKRAKMVIRNTEQRLLNKRIWVINGTGPPFRGPPFWGSAIPGIRVRVGLGLRLRLTLVDLRNGVPPEWRTEIVINSQLIALRADHSRAADSVKCVLLEDLAEAVFAHVTNIQEIEFEKTKDRHKKKFERLLEAKKQASGLNQRSYHRWSTWQVGH